MSGVRSCQASLHVSTAIQSICASNARRFTSPPEHLISPPPTGHFVMLNSPGTSRAACFDPAETIMITSVRM
jgi:hypothetical protein